MKDEPGVPKEPNPNNSPVRNSSNMGGLSLVPTFNGDRSSSVDVVEFINVLEEVAALEGWEDNAKLGALRLLLRAEAKYFLRAENPKTFDEAKELLLNQYTFVPSLAKVLPLLTEQRQNLKESPRSYLQRLQGIKSRVLQAFSEEDKKQVIKLVENALISTLLIISGFF